MSGRLVLCGLWVTGNGLRVITGKAGRLEGQQAGRVAQRLLDSLARVTTVDLQRPQIACLGNGMLSGSKPS